MLIDLRKSLSYILRIEPEQIDHHHAAGARGQIAAVAVFANVSFETFAFSETKKLRLGWCDDEAVAVQLYAGRAKTLVR